MIMKAPKQAVKLTSAVFGKNNDAELTDRLFRAILADGVGTFCHSLAGISLTVKCTEKSASGPCKKLFPFSLLPAAVFPLKVNRMLFYPVKPATPAFLACHVSDASFLKNMEIGRNDLNGDKRDFFLPGFPRKIGIVTVTMKVP